MWRQTKLTEAQARKIKYGSEPASELALHYGVSTVAIYSIRNGKNWKWI